MPEDKMTVKGDWWRAHQPDKRFQGHIIYWPMQTRIEMAQNARIMAPQHVHRPPA